MWFLCIPRLFLPAQPRSRFLQFFEGSSAVIS
uniref:Uncharacterized protein n=1 Tax=Zea mays TaxID=4577 RepID=B4FN77_MAIZE|nr:unknown [Zea mays]